MPYRIAMIGCGGVAPMHGDGYKTHAKRVQMVAACDLDAARAQRFADAYGVGHVYDTLEAALEAEWEVGVVCTPTSVRKGIVAALAGAGKHIYVEKPLADTLEAAGEMVSICERADVKLTVDQNFRYHYPFHIARRVIAEGKIGPVAQVLHRDQFFRQDTGWRILQPRHGMAIMGIHWLDGFRWMLGTEARSLMAQTGHSAAVTCAGETEATVQITFENGVLGTYVQSFSSPLARTETIIIGETGTLTLDYAGVSLYDKAHGNAPAERWENADYGGAKKPESAYAGLEALLMALDNGTEPENSGRDNLKTVGLLDAAYRSAETGRPITFREGLPQ